MIKLPFPHTQATTKKHRAPDMEISTNEQASELEIFEVGSCENGYKFGYLIGQRFSKKIQSRLSKDLILKNQLLPFAKSKHSRPLLESLFQNNQKKYPKYWDELRGTAQGSGTPFLEIMLLNFRKEILPLISKAEKDPMDDSNGDCSDILVVSDSMAVAAHNEDANVALVGHTYLIKGVMLNGASFIAYTYAGELPSCAFGFNTHGLAFTLNSVPPSENEIEAGAIGRNFISRDLLEAQSIDDSLTRIYSSEASVGHSYNLIDLKTRRIMNVETASRNRVSIHEIGAVPFFHANMYLHLQVHQAQDDNSLSRQKRAALMPKGSKGDFLSILGDQNDAKYHIYMTGPLLHTLCTVIIDLDEKTISIIEGNPKERKTPFIFPMSCDNKGVPGNFPIFNHIMENDKRDKQSALKSMIKDIVKA